jgi:hypothetical protein
LKFIDILVETIQKACNDPSQEKEVLYFLIMDLALKSDKLIERKAWETLASLVSSVWKERKFPSLQEIEALKAKTNSIHRSGEPRISRVLFSLREIEWGEASVKKFLAEKAWKGLAGFDEDGTPWK